MFMLLALSNCKISIENAIQAEKKSKSACEVLGYRLVKGPWPQTYVMEAETDDDVVSCLIIEKDNGSWEQAGPLRIVKKDKKELKNA